VEQKIPNLKRKAMQTAQEKFEQTQDHVKRGLSVKAACEKTGMTVSNYYNWRSRKLKPGPKKRRLGMKPFVVEAAPGPKTLAVAFGSPGEVAALIRELRQ
jgi:predicted DNA-binding transcriptional regulator AlpA